MEIDQAQEPDYECVRVDHVGFVDPYAVEGLVVLQGNDGQAFHIRAFSGEVSKHIESFLKKDLQHTPTIYKMIDEICEHSEMFLVKVKIYESGQVLRANLYLTGKNDLVLKNYRASDAVALAVYYGIPILVRKNLLKKRTQN